jgi:hypothetical protein
MNLNQTPGLNNQSVELARQYEVRDQFEVILECSYIKIYMTSFKGCKIMASFITHEINDIIVNYIEI